MTIHKPCEVVTFPDMKMKQEITLADKTSQIDLVLWRQRAENVDFKAGDVLSLQNVVVSTFQQQITVTTSFETSLNVIEKDIAVTKEAKALDKPVQTKTTVLVIKNFQSVSKCFLRKVSHHAATITCPVVDHRLYNLWIFISKNKRFFESVFSGFIES